MDVWSADKLAIFLAFVIPGFVALKVYGLLEPHIVRDSSQQLVDAIAYSSLNYAIWLWPILHIENGHLRERSFGCYALFYALVVFVSPVVLAFAWRLLRTWRWLARFFPHPTGRPWDYVFRQRKPYWMLITLKDGKQVGGRFDSSSFASSAPSPDQLFLEESWHINDDGGFDKEKKATAGMLIAATDILMLELYTVEDKTGESSGRNQTDETSRTAEAR